jgi:class 3 adenylate cyclase
VEKITRSTGMRSISERLLEAANQSFVGRQSELSLLSEAVRAEVPPFLVTFIHGPGGIGKSRLLQAFLNADYPGIRRYVLDCGDIEPTPKGFLSALGSAIKYHGSEPDLSAVVAFLIESAQRTVIALDTYETYGLMDTWLRQVFVPSLTENIFTIIVGRQAPNPAWYTSPGWQDLFKEIKLRELSADEAQMMLVSRGLTPDQIDRVKGFSRGHPLALEMAAAALRSQPNLEISEGPPPKVLRQLTSAFLGGLTPETAEAVEAASSVRRVTEPLLKALLDASDTKKVYERLETLPFIDVTAEGLNFHDVVRDTISKDLVLRDPEKYRLYRKRAYTFFSKKLQRAAARSLWQYTADMLYLIENPIVREAFFPEGATDIRFEPATVEDGKAICQIASDKEPEKSAQLIAQWWVRHPETFSVAKAPDGTTVAFYNLFEPQNVDQILLKRDPLTAVWLRHLIENPLAEGERVLFSRRWLDATTGENPSAAVSACFLDVKRTYMELRPTLRRIYFPVRDLSLFRPILSPLGFTPLEGATVSLDGIDYHSLMNDFGPASIDGWLATRVGAELGIDPGDVTAIGRGPERRLVTVLFTDIVGSTERAAELGDSRWRDLLESHHNLVRKVLSSFQGREIDTAGDGFLVTFDKPAQGIRCAAAIRESVRSLGIEIRAGLHLGECEMVGDAVRGIAVHIGARVASKAEADEVLVSGTVKDAVTGSGIPFEDRGAHVLKGIPGEWHLFALKEDK